MKKYILPILAAALISACSNENPDAAQEKKKSVAELYPPINLKDWEKTPAINGRLPTKEEAENGTALLYFPNPGPDVKAYDMHLPQLAFYTDAKTGERDLVVVIQMVETKTDTLVGYRPLSGLNGSSTINDFRFLTPEEIMEIKQD